MKKNGFTRTNFVKQNLRGFTLVEILVVIGITAIVGTILVVIFTNTLRGSNKAQILAVIKQNGQSVLENMDKTIRNAYNVVCPASGSGNTLVVEKNGEYTRYRIALSANSYIPLSCYTNGCIVWEKSTTLPSCDPADPMFSANILTDTNAQTGVKINSGSFYVNRPAGFKAAVTINFILSPGVNASSIITSQIDPVVFQTTIGLR